jgi:predicted RNase H-like HicB family nuclease
MKMKKLNLIATLWEEECVWVVKFLETGVASCGDTPQEALSNLKEALELYLENARELGMRDDLDTALTSAHKFTALIEPKLRPLQ